MSPVVCAGGAKPEIWRSDPGDMGGCATSTNHLNSYPVQLHQAIDTSPSIARYPPMFSNSAPASPSHDDPFVSYSQALHDYTLRLWTESRRIAEEKARSRAARKEEASRRRREMETKLMSSHFLVGTITLNLEAATWVNDQLIQ
ncbi:hypothetical protein V8E55_000407 [Tylopilus felleus]